MSTPIDDAFLREFAGLLVRPPAWHRLAACRGMGPDLFFTERAEGLANHGTEAKKLCAQCPALIDCLEDSVQRHLSHGIQGGCGDGERRVFQRALEVRPHETPELVDGCGCSWCVNLVLLIRRLDGDRTAVADTNGAGARHGRRSTQARGCRCFGCRWAASAIGQDVSRFGVDTADWWDQWGGDGDEYEAVRAPADEAAVRLLKIRAARVAPAA